MTPRASSSFRAASGGADLLPSIVAPMPTAPATVQNLPVDPPTPGVSASGGLSHGLTRFFETLGIADDPVWRGPQDGECPF